MLSNIRKDQHTKARFYCQKSPRKIASKTRKKSEAGRIAEFDSKRKNLEKDLTIKIYILFCSFSAAFFSDIANNYKFRYRNIMICILIDGVGRNLEYKIQSYIFILDRLNKYYIHTL